MTDLRDNPELRELIRYIAAVSRAVGEQACVGGMETAGSIISYLDEHPDDLEPFLRGGFFELPIGFHERGNLTWHAMNGKVVAPEYARRARTIRDLRARAADTRTQSNG